MRHDLPAERERKAGTAELPGEQLDALWADLANPDARKAYAALHVLITSPKQAAALFQARVRPVDQLDPQRVAQLFADLESNVFITRKRASDGLESLGLQQLTKQRGGFSAATSAGFLPFRALRRPSR